MHGLKCPINSTRTYLEVVNDDGGIVFFDVVVEFPGLGTFGNPTHDAHIIHDADTQIETRSGSRYSGTL